MVIQMKKMARLKKRVLAIKMMPMRYVEQVLNECLNKDSTIALYSHPSGFELFYICKVVDFCELRDKSDYFIENGQHYNIDYSLS